METNMIGLRVQDRVTGIVGVVAGCARYITGRALLLVAPALPGDTMARTIWIDQSWCDIVGEAGAELGEDAIPAVLPCPPNLAPVR